MFSEKMIGIIRKQNMSARPAHYSGRGVSYGDLNEKQISNIHREIKEQFGIQQALSFVQMIKDTPILSACEFLQALDFLEYFNFQWDKDLINHISSVPAEQSEFGATMMGLALKLNDTNPKEREVSASNYLKQNFLKSNLSKNEYGEWMKENYKTDTFGDFLVKKHF